MSEVEENGPPDDTIDLPSKYHKSSEYQELHNVIDPILANHKSEKVAVNYHLWNRWCHTYETNFFWQVHCQLNRLLYVLSILYLGIDCDGQVLHKFVEKSWDIYIAGTFQ